jgi:hypothetical protein
MSTCCALPLALVTREDAACRRWLIIAGPWLVVKVGLICNMGGIKKRAKEELSLTLSVCGSGVRAPP